MSGRSEFSKRIKELRGDRSQGKFAKAIGIPRPNISEYEAGTKVPGYKPLVALIFESSFQGRRDLARWFADQTGDANLRLIADSVRSDAEAQAEAKANRDVESHALASVAIPEAAPLLPVLSLPGWIVEGHRAPEYMQATGDFVFPYRRGDVILLNSSHADDLSKLVGREVIALRREHFSRTERTRLENGFAEKMSPDEVRRRRARGQFPFLRTGVFVGRLVIDQTIGGMPAIEVRTKSGDTLLEYIPTRTGKAVDPTRERFAELQVLGEVVGYLAPARTTGGQGYKLNRMLRGRGFPGGPGILHRVAEPKK